MKRIGDLEIDQDLTFQEKEWHVQRIGWTMLLIILLLALLGLFGTGPISSATAGNTEDGLTLDYERFVRHDGRASLTMEVSPGQISDGQIELWLSSTYLDNVEVQQISPQPDEVRVDGERQIYVFLVENPSEPVTMDISLQPRAMGRLSGDVGIAGGVHVTFNQFSYP